MKKIIIAGSRTFSDYARLKLVLDAKEPFELISGGARGADRLGERYAEEKRYPCRIFPANWGLYGKKAGYLRNEKMARYADVLVAFWDGESKGTKHMIDLANQYGLEVQIEYFPTSPKTINL